MSLWFSIKELVRQTMANYTSLAQVRDENTLNYHPLNFYIWMRFMGKEEAHYR